MEGKLSKKLTLLIVKYGTWVIGLAYFLQVILTCFGIQSFLLTDLFGLAIIPTIALLAFSFFLGFCYWHRLPIYYALLANIINIIDFLYWYFINRKVNVDYIPIISRSVYIGWMFN